MKVSVIVPVYNGARYVSAALDSILTQTYPVYEIIVVDDGSTDSSPEILRSFGERLKVLRQDNQGVAAARNAGLDRASGELIAFLDQDDLWPRDRTQQMVEALASEPEAELAVGMVEILYQRDSKPDPRENMDTMYREYFLGSLLVQAKVFDKLGSFNTGIGYSDDTDFWLRREENEIRTVYVNEVALVYRMHGANTSLDRNVSHFHFLSAIRERLKRRRMKSHEHKLPTPRP